MLHSKIGRDNIQVKLETGTLHEITVYNLAKMIVFLIRQFQSRCFNLKIIYVISDTISENILYKTLLLKINRLMINDPKL